MSRCFPYPPPGFAGNKSASNDALIWTIKLQRESENVKLEKKKDRKKERKEKKREDKANGTLNGEKKKRDDKPNGTLFGEKKLLTADEKLYQATKNAKYSEDCGQIKQQETSYERMEKSSLTEEHGMPCCSSDSTENSGKRKRQYAPQAGNTTRTSGTVFRIVLNSRKKEDGPTKSSSNASLSLTTGRVDTSSQKAIPAVKTSASILPSPPAKSNATQQLIITSSSEVKLPCPVKEIDQASTSKEEKKLPRPLRKYNALFENWVPPSMEIETVNDDDDWLFGSKPEKRVKCCAEEVVPSCGKPAMQQPRAHFLSDVGIYALPFAVPF